jgi:hypothetical protein
MRKSALLFASIFLLALSACTDNQKELKETAKGYLQAMGDYRIEEAAPFATQYTRETTIPLLKHIVDHTDTNYIKQNTPSTITIKGARMLSDSTARVYYHKHTPIKELDDSVKMVLEDGHWLVDVRIQPSPFLNIPDTLQPRIPISSIKAVADN